MVAYQHPVSQEERVWHWILEEKKVIRHKTCGLEFCSIWVFPPYSESHHYLTLIDSKPTTDVTTKCGLSMMIRIKS